MKEIETIALSESEELLGLLRQEHVGIHPIRR
jgi:hypothetical protein